jgi:hypothetical protein
MAHWATAFLIGATVLVVTFMLPNVALGLFLLVLGAFLACVIGSVIIDLVRPSKF